MIAAAIFVLAGVTAFNVQIDLTNDVQFYAMASLTSACFVLAVLCAIGVLA